MSCRLAGAFACGLIVLAGCAGEAADQSAENASEPPRRLAGPYLLVVSQNGGPQAGYLDLYAARLEFPEKPDGKIALKEATRAFPAATLVESRIDGKRVRLVFESQGDRVDFEGITGSDAVWGTFCVGGLQCMPARLIPAEDGSFEGDEIATRANGAAELLKLQQGRAGFEELLGFCRRNPRSPAVFDLYAELIPYLSALKYSEEQTRDYARDYIKAASRWGERASHIAQINVGYSLAATEHLPQLGLEYLRDVEKQLSPAQAGAARPLIQQAEEVARRAEARELIAGGGTARALEILEGLRKKRPLDPVVTHLLAISAEKEGQTDRAIDLYGEVVALPRLEAMLINGPGWQREDERPGQALERLWKKTHGSDDGLSAFLDEIYVEAVSRVGETADLPPAATTGNRVVLGELFTGAKCPPCVASDVAGMALEATYPRAELLILRYHQHSPAEDPLANRHTSQRFAYYVPNQLDQHTPTFAVNGRVVDRNVGGLMMMAPTVYGTLRNEIDPLLAKDSKFTLNVSAVDQEGTLSLSAAVEGEPLSEELRLRLVLAEDDLSFEAQNGVRQHRLIVRNMPGGPEGVAPTEGKLAFTGTVQIDELRRRLLEDLALVEQNLDVRFPEKPARLKPLYFVAFVQDERTKEILQAAGVPVSGHEVATTGADRTNANGEGNGASPATVLETADLPIEAPPPQLESAESSRGPALLAPGNGP